MNKTIIMTLLLLYATINIESRKMSSRGRSSGSRSSSSRSRSNSHPAPTSLTNPQPSAAKPSLFGWQEKAARPPQNPSNKPSHSYPSSQTGLSGNNVPNQAATYQESIHRNKAPVPVQQTPQKDQIQSHATNGMSHSYPVSNGMSGNSKPGGLSGSGTGYPEQHSIGGASRVGYPSQQGSGFSGKQSETYQESVQKNNAPIPVQQSPQLQGTNPMSHSYPVSNSLSGNSNSGGLSGSGLGNPRQQSVGSGVGYPPQQGSGFSGSNAAPPPYNPVDVNRPYNGGHPANNFGNSYHHPQHPQPPYSSFPQSYGGFGGHGHNPGYNPQMPGYFGTYVNNGKKFGGMSRTSSALTGVGIAGAGVGTILTGLALWNLARSTGHHHNTVIYDNRGQPVAVAPGNSTEPVVDPILGDLVNCTLTISNENVTEILAIPCAIATSFTPDAEVKDSNINNDANDNTKCTITVVSKTSREYMTTIPCSILLSTAASNNVSEPPGMYNDTEINNGTLMPLDTVLQDQPAALRLASNNTIEYNEKFNCTLELGETRDPINPCLSIASNLTVIPLSTTEKPKEVNSR